MVGLYALQAIIYLFLSKGQKKRMLFIFFALNFHYGKFLDSLCFPNRYFTNYKAGM